MRRVGDWPEPADRGVCLSGVMDDDHRHARDTERVERCETGGRRGKLRGHPKVGMP
jgi:hypothetical protein